MMHEVRFIVKMRHLAAAFMAFVAFAGARGAEGPATIRRTDRVPFADGRRVQEAWSRADTLTGFIVPGLLDAAIDDTDVQFLHDGRFLYISMRGRLEKGFRQERGFAVSNGFEICFAQSKGARQARRFTFPQDGELQVSDLKPGASGLKPETGTRRWMFASDGLLEINAQIPLASLGVGMIGGGTRIAVLVMRRNVCFRDGFTETSAWCALPDKAGIYDTSMWGEAVFAPDGGGSPVVVFAPSNGQQVNYCANPEFDVAGRVWRLDGGDLTMRCETAPMSREWIIRTMGNTYWVFCGTPQRYERDTEYTLAVTARGVGGEAQMNILEVYRRDGDGKICEGPQIARHVLLGESFHTYYFVFRSSDNGDPNSIIFYKWEPKNAADRGIDVANVRLYRGKVHVLDIRKMSRSPRKAPQGRGVPVTANPYGHIASPPKGLVFSLRFHERREIREVFEGTGIQVDVLTVSSPDQDTYYTDDDIETVKRRIKEKKYDFFVVMSHVAGSVGPELSAKVLEAVEGGAGLYFMYSPNRGHFGDVLGKAGLRALGPDHPIVKSYPRDIGCGVRNFSPTVLFREGRIGNGKVFLEGSGRTGAFKFTMSQTCYGETDFPYSSFADPLMVKIIRSISHGGAAYAPHPVKTFWRAIDAWGMVRRTGEANGEDEAFAQAKASCGVSGKYAVAFRSVDAQGATTDWSARCFEKDGPKIGLVGERTSCSGDDSAVFRAEVKGMSGTGCVRWTLEDFAGRIVEEGAVKCGDRFEVPTKALYTNKGVVRAYLVPGGYSAVAGRPPYHYALGTRHHVPGTILAVARADIYARDRDWQRLGGDFTVGIWGQGAIVSRETSQIIDRLLLDHGILYQCNPIDYFSKGNRNYAYHLASGMAVGGGYLGDSSWFFPKKLDDSNVRSGFGPINTEKGHKALAELSGRLASEARRFGPIAYAVCDEPNLSLRFTKDEPDEEPENVAEFRRRMEVKYGTLAEYNRRHRTSHASFVGIGPVRIEDARRTGNFAEYVEWRNFNVDRWCEAIKVVADAGGEADSTCRLSLFNSFGQTAVSGNDYWKLLTKAGLKFSNEYTSMVYMRRNAICNFDEFYRSFRPDMRVWGFTGYTLSEPQIRFTPWWFAAHRYGGFTWFSVLTWDWRYFDQPSLAYTLDSMEMKSALDRSRMLDGLGRLFLSYDWAPRQAAIYYSHDSLLVSTLLGKERISYDIGKDGPLHDYMYSRQGLQYTIEDLLYQHDFIAPEQVVSDDRLNGYRIVFMPGIVALSDAEVAKLKAFAANGGRIVADRLPGDYDELGVKRAANPFSPAEIMVIGSNFDDLSVAWRKNALALLRESGAAPVLVSEGIENVFGREAMHFTDGTNAVFIVMRQPLRSNDSETQTFAFPAKGHVYDVRTGRYLGFTDRVTAAVPHAEACVWAVLPRKVGGLRISAPLRVPAGSDLVADLALDGATGKGVFHVEVVSPNGECRFHMKRNLDSVGGKARLVFRMARNDVPGKWTLRATDATTRVSAERTFEVR